MEYANFQEIHRGINSNLFKVTGSDGRPYVLKTQTESGTSKAHSQIFTEYANTKDLHIPGVRKAIEFYGKSSIEGLILEFFEGISLKNYMHQYYSKQITEKRINLFFTIAIQIVEILERIHTAKIIHKDINANNILIHPTSLDTCIIDFGISSKFEKEKKKAGPVSELEGTLQYISPEQTGRMNRKLDYRSDYYSLGVVFYEFITGNLPFIQSDPMELVHAHLAKIPAEPDASLSIPREISRIILKLLSKNQEDRYQTAFGLLEDLKECSRLYQNKELASSGFQIGTKDFNTDFRIPDKLYGREKETGHLLNEFDTVSTGKKSIVLVSGNAGIGKSMLVHELYSPITSKKGFFLEGKFEEYKKSLPYYAWASAFNNFINQIIAGSEEEISYWKKIISNAIGENFELLVEIIPALGSLLGKDSAKSRIAGGLEEKNRLEFLFGKFIKVICKEEHPICIFIDDWQWVDSASLDLLVKISNQDNLQYLLLICAYRENEVSSTHPFALALESIDEKESLLTEIKLQPLNVLDIRELIRDTVGSENSEELADILFSRTKGNPFFINKLLQTIHEEDLLFVNLEKRIWVWDSDKIRNLDIKENIVEFLTARIEKLSSESKEVLLNASSIGYGFQLSTLAKITNKNFSELKPILSEFISDDLIILDSGNLLLIEDEDNEEALNIKFKFTHDRIWQASYSMIMDTEKKKLHYKIAEILYSCYENKLESQVFEIVNHFNIALSLLGETDKPKVHELNVLAAQKAKQAVAFEASYQYYQNAILLLPTNSWATQPKKLTELYSELASMAFGTGRYDEVDSILEIVETHSHNILDRIPIYETYINTRVTQNRGNEAVRMFLKVSTQLGENYPENPSKFNVIKELIRLKFYMGRKNLQDFTNISPMQDPKYLALNRIANSAASSTFKFNPFLYPLNVFKRMVYFLRFGYPPYAAGTFVSYGVILSTALGKTDEGNAFCDYAFQVLEKDSYSRKSRLLFATGTLVKHWVEPLRKVTQMLLLGYKIGIEAGDLEFASYNASTYNYYNFWAGMELSELLENYKAYIEAVEKYNQISAVNYLTIGAQLVDSLRSGNITSNLSGEFINHEKMLTKLQKAEDLISLFFLYSNHAYFSYLMGDYEKAKEFAEKALDFTKGANGFATVHIHQFNMALVLLKLKDISLSLKYINLTIKNLQKWAKKAPFLYSNKYHLLLAEFSRKSDNPIKAKFHFEKAIAESRKYQFIQEEALAWELFAEYSIELTEVAMAEVYLQKSYQCYARWGANTKLKQLELKYPELLMFSITKKPTRTEGATIQRTTYTSSSTGTAIGNYLDMGSIIKASQALSSEIRLEQLIDKLMKIVIENAGAENGFLALQKDDGNWYLEASLDSTGKVHFFKSLLLEKASNNVPFTILSYVIRTKESLVLGNAHESSKFSKDPIFQTKKVNSVFCLPLINRGNLAGILYLENNIANNAFTASHTEILNMLSSQIAVSIENATIYQNISELNTTYEKFVPKEFLSLLGRKKISGIQLGEQVQKEMTILFSDIRSFTTLSESMSPAENFNFLNSYFSRIGPITRRNGGFIDKYIGDAIMALFPESPEDALVSGIQMQEALVLYNSHRMKNGYKPIEIGIGIHAGLLMLGTVGEEERMEGTVISDAVNLASRIESLTKYYGASILISEDTLLKLQNPKLYNMRFLGSVIVPGKTKKINILEVLDGRKPEERQIFIDTKEKFLMALDNYLSQNFSDSLKGFTEIVEANPQDKTSMIYLTRSKLYLQKGTPENWDGAEVLDEK